MVGTKSGWLKTEAAFIKKFGSYEAYIKWRQDCGRKGGKRGCTGGFASEKVGADGLTGHERAKICGVKGGRISKRRKVNA